MKKYLLLTFFAFLSLGLSAQLNLEWTKSIPLAGGRLAYDNSGNIYLASFSGAANPTIQKMNASGNVLWTVGYQCQANINSIAIDGSGNIYISGNFVGSNVDFDPGPGTALYSSSGNSDIFYQKLDNSGALIWTQVLGTASDEQSWSLSVESGGNLLAAGTIGSSSLVRKINALDGSTIWSLTMGAGVAAVDVESDATGNVFVGGSFGGTVDFDPSPSTYSITSPTTDLFLLKLTSAGAFTWVRGFGGSNTENPSQVVIDNAHSRVILSGTCWSNGNPSIRTSTSTTVVSNWSSGGAVNPIYTVWDLSGNYVGGQNVDTYSQTCTLVGTSVTASGNIAMSYHSQNFDTSNQHNYLAIYPAGFGTNLRREITQQSSSDILGWDMLVDSNDYIYIVGFFYTGKLDMDPGWRVTNLTQTATNRGFLSKLNQRIDQSITFAPVTGKTVGDAPFTLNATSSSGLPVTFTSSNTAVATVTGNTVTVIGPGLTNITASQPGNTTYDAAQPIMQPLPVCNSCTYSQARLWGVTTSGGANNSGVIFRTNSDGTGYSVVYDFGGTNGSSPNAALTQGVNGKIYGVTAQGGSNNNGVIFELDPSTNTYTKKFDFLNATTGSPAGNLALASNGKLYGTTGGSIFEFDPVAGTFATKYQATIAANGTNLTGLSLFPDNKLYGFAQMGGQSNHGVLYSFNPGSGSYTKIIDLTYEGRNPMGNPVLASNGKSYGATYDGGIGGGNGVFPSRVFEIDMVSFATNETTQLGPNDSSNPIASGGLIQSANGKLYGSTTFGAVWPQDGILYEIDLVNPVSTIPAYNYTTIVDFDKNVYLNPVGTPFEALNGKLYMFTSDGLHQVDPNPGQGSSFINRASFSSANGTSPTGSLIQEKAVQSIALAPATKNFGDAPFTLPATSSAGLPITYTSSDPSIAMISGNNVTIMGVGVAIITASQAGNQIFLPAVTVQQSLTINKALLTVTADPQSKTFGASNPQLTYTVTGFVNGENVSILTTPPNTAPNASTTALTCSPIGTYTITPSGGSNNHYSFNYVSSTLTITKASITAQADSKSKTYGSGNPGVTITYTGLVCGDGAIDTPPAFSMTASQWSGVGSYGINLVAGGSDNNYNFSAYYNGTLSITPASQWMTSFSGVQTVFCSTGASFGLYATASSGLAPVFWSSNSGVISVSGNTAYVVGYGSATIYASQPGNGNYYGSDTWSQGVSVSGTGGSISASGTTNICHTGSVWLTADNGIGNYSWNTGQTSQSILATEPGTYSVTYTNSGGCPASASRTVTRTGSGCTNNRMASDLDIDSISVDQNPNGLFGISPNPTSKEITVRLSAIATIDSQVSFTDMLGRDRKQAVIEKGEREKKIPIADLEPGSYIVNIRDGKRFRQRILIITN